MPRPLDVAAFTDEIADTLPDALALAQAWGVTRVELREGSTGRFPHFTAEEIGLLEGARRDGVRVTAVSPGIFKGSIADAARLARELSDVLPRTLDLAARLGCRSVVAFGFERTHGEPDAHRARVVDAFARAAEAAHAAGMTVAVENEPGFWVDLPGASAALVREVDHAALGLNWDPANLHWGGVLPTYEGFRAVRPHLAGLHVKDFYPDDPAAPWRAVGDGITPWAEILRWIADETDLPHVTLETHTLPRTDASRRSLEWLRANVE